MVLDCHVMVHIVLVLGRRCHVMPSPSTSQWSCGCSGAVAVVVFGGAGVISVSSSSSVTTSDRLRLFVFCRSVCRVVLLPRIWSRAFFARMMGSVSSWWLRSGRRCSPLTRSSVVPCVTQYVFVAGPVRPSSVITMLLVPSSVVLVQLLLVHLASRTHVGQCGTHIGWPGVVVGGLS